MPRRGFSDLLMPRTAIALAIAIMLTLTSSVSHAAWTANTSTTGSATSGTIGVTAGGTADLTGTYTTVPSALGTSATVRTAAVTVVNTGTVPLSYSLAVTGATGALAGQIQLQVWRNVSNCTTPAASATTGTLAAPPALPTNAATAAAGASFVLCVRTTFTGVHESYLGQTVAPVIEVRGTVGTNWNASATGSFNQTVAASWYSIKHLDSGRCVDGFAENTTAGTDVIIWDCKALSQTNNQSWRFALTSGANYRVVAGYTALVWAAEGTSVGSDVALYGSGGARQEWTAEQHGPAGYYRFVNSASGRCLTFNANANETVGEVRNCGTSTDLSDGTFRDQAFQLTVIP